MVGGPIDPRRSPNSSSISFSPWEKVPEGRMRVRGLLWIPLRPDPHPHPSHPQGDFLTVADGRGDCFIEPYLSVIDEGASSAAAPHALFGVAPIVNTSVPPLAMSA
jgi:hypothetical protein